MALKYTPKENLVAKIGDKEIEFTPWTAKNEREYLQLLEKDTPVTDKDIYDTLIAPSIKDKTIVLSSDEQKLLMIEIRKESLGKTFKDTIKCGKCEEEIEQEISIDEVVSYKKSSWEPIVVEDMTFILGDIKTNKAKEKLTADRGVVNYIFTDFMLHVHSIEINGEINDKFTFKELNDFMDSLPAKIFDEVFEKYQEQVDVLKLEHSFICPKCGHSDVISYGNIPGFLWV